MVHWLQKFLEFGFAHMATVATHCWVAETLASTLEPPWATHDGVNSMTTVEVIES